MKTATVEYRTEDSGTRRVHRTTVDGRPHRTLGRSADDGNSMVEVLAAIVLMAIVVTGVLAGLLAAVRAGEVSNSEAETNAVLSGAVDRVTRGGWLACPATDSSGGYEARVDAAAASAEVDPDDISVVLIRYWNTSTMTWSTTNPFASACTAVGAAITPDATLQLVSIRVTSPDGQHTKTIDAVVGNVSSGGSSG